MHFTVLLLLLLLLLLFSASIMMSVIPNNPVFSNWNECGIFDPKDNNNNNGNNNNNNNNNGNRIINGRKVDRHRPWMVRIAEFKKEKSAMTGFCGGSIITRWFVLTAAHCFCDEDNSGRQNVVSCDLKNVGRPKVLREATASGYLVFMGSHLIRTEVDKGHSAQAIIVHPQMQLEQEPWSFDIALVHTKEELVFTPMVMPICLPSPAVQLGFPQVYVSGWGVVRAELSKSNASSACSTNQFGPAKFSPCKTDADGNPCHLGKPPNYDDYRGSCAKLMEKTVIEERVDIAVVGSTACYLDKKHGRNGWCLVHEEDKKTKWGFCMPACNYTLKQKSDHLQEVQLDVVNEAYCGRNMDPTNELCIGKLQKMPTFGYYENEKDHFRLSDISPPKYYDFVGFQDSCQGDSGGPYYLYTKDGNNRSRPVVVGLVSRGEGCAEVGEPGKATNVARFVSWIDSVIRVGESHSPSSAAAPTPQNSSNITRGRGGSRSNGLASRKDQPPIGHNLRMSKDPWDDQWTIRVNLTIIEK